MILRFNQFVLENANNANTASNYPLIVKIKLEDKDGWWYNNTELAQMVTLLYESSNKNYLEGFIDYIDEYLKFLVKKGFINKYNYKLLPQEVDDKVKQSMADDKNLQELLNEAQDALHYQLKGGITKKVKDPVRKEYLGTEDHYEAFLFNVNHGMGNLIKIFRYDAMIYLNKEKLALFQLSNLVYLGKKDKHSFEECTVVDETGLIQYGNVGALKTFTHMKDPFKQLIKPDLTLDREKMRESFFSFDNKYGSHFILLNKEGYDNIIKINTKPKEEKKEDTGFWSRLKKSLGLS